MRTVKQIRIPKLVSIARARRIIEDGNTPSMINNVLTMAAKPSVSALKVCVFDVVVPFDFNGQLALLRVVDDELSWSVVLTVMHKPLVGSLVPAAHVAVVHDDFEICKDHGILWDLSDASILPDEVSPAPAIATIAGSKFGDVMTR
jgi:hypothetical protein